jgi:hypothetical protein
MCFRMPRVIELSYDSRLFMVMATSEARVAGDGVLDWSIWVLYSCTLALHAVQCYRSYGVNLKPLCMPCIVIHSVCPNSFAGSKHMYVASLCLLYCTVC